MNEIAILSKAKPREILQTVIEKKAPAIMSYFSKGKWHVAKASLTNLEDNKLNIRISPKKKGSIFHKSRQTPTNQSLPTKIQVNQPVGISLKYGYGKFIFETKVVALQPSIEPTSSGTITLMVPERIEMVQRRSYFRVDVPSSLKVNVMLWRILHTDEMTGIKQTEAQTSNSPRIPQERYWQGKLIDISAGGVRLVVETAQKNDFKKGQFIGLRFTPMPYETPLMFDTQIKNIQATACEKGTCLGLRIVGLEASPEGRQILQRICDVAERYYKMNQCTLSRQDYQMTGSSH